MADTFLLEPVLQSAVVISQSTIRGQDALEVRAQDIDDHITAAVIADSIHSDLSMGEDPQPSRERADPPTGLVCIAPRLHCRIASSSSSYIGRAVRANF